jgi:hypothetical protein
LSFRKCVLGLLFVQVFRFRVLFSFWLNMVSHVKFWVILI